MGRYPKISETKDRFDSWGNKLCRNCEEKVSQSRKHYCSERCMDEFNRNNSWFFVRKDVLRRDRYTCSFCKQRFKKKDLDVDHIVPIKKGGSVFDKNNLRTMCKACHKIKTKLE